LFSQLLENEESQVAHDLVEYSHFFYSFNYKDNSSELVSAIPEAD